MNIDKHKARMNANGSIGDSFGNATKNKINSSFKNSPFYKIIKIDGLDTEVRFTERAGLINLKSSQHKLLTFRPDTKINIGAVCEHDNSMWLTIDFTNNDLFPLAAIQRMNEQLRWRNEKGEMISTPCIVNKSPMDRIFVKGNSHDVQTVDQMMYVLIKYDDISKQIKNGQRFVLGRQVYSVNGIDDLSYVHQGVGVVQVIIRFDNKKETDDMINKVADNIHLFGQGSIPNEENPTDTDNPTPPEDNGGGWW